MIQHVVIRKPEFFAGDGEKPSIQVFHANKYQKISFEIREIKAPSDNMDEMGRGPIVAKAQISSWHSGKVEDGIINDARELTIGTLLFGLDIFWENLIEKKEFNYVVVRLMNEEYLEKKIYPTVKSYGRSWVYLDSQEKVKSWLLNYDPPEPSKNKRRSIPKGLRWDVLRRDSFTCQYCGRKQPEVKLHVDHIIPWSKVKKHEISNLVTSCRDCNLGKSNKMI